MGLETGLIELDRLVPLRRDEETLEHHSKDEGDAEGVRPEAVVYPRSTQEVASVLQIAAKHRIPITPRGAGTSRVGGAVPCAGGIVLATESLGARIDIDEENSRAFVSAGAITADVHRSAEDAGLFYGPDPSSAKECRIGGNIACNAAGPRAFKYGATSRWILGLEVVSAEGEVLHLGAGTSKGVTGYNLKSLITGSEGTLAVVCGATLRLRPAPPQVATLVASLESEEKLVPAIHALLQLGVEPRCLEFLDGLALDILARDPKSAYPDDVRSVLLVELDGENLASAVERAGNALLTAGARDVDAALSASDQERLWRPRRQMSRLLRQTAKFKLSEDIVVPRSHLSQLLSRTRGSSERSEVRIATYGHAGDGNLHINFFWDDDEEKRRVDGVVESLFHDVLELGGSLSGEHGIGLTKAPFIGLELDQTQLELQRRIKDLFDPKNILNPGKIFGARSGHGPC